MNDDLQCKPIDRPDLITVGMVGSGKSILMEKLVSEKPPVGIVVTPVTDKHVIFKDDAALRL